jgi:hypothetical protein
MQERVGVATTAFANPYISRNFVGLAMSACLFTSSPRPSCTADKSAALRATASVRSIVHVWPCSAPLQPVLRLPFPYTPLLVIVCAHLTFHHSLSCPISHFPPRFPYAFLTALCPFWHICCLDTGFWLPYTPPFALLEVPLESPHSVLSKEPKRTPI